MDYSTEYMNLDVRLFLITIFFGFISLIFFLTNREHMEKRTLYLKFFISLCIAWFLANVSTFIMVTSVELLQISGFIRFFTLYVCPSIFFTWLNQNLYNKA